MDRPIDEWIDCLRPLTPEELAKAWQAKADSKSSWEHEINYHVAAAERMKHLGHMAIDLDDDVRRDLCNQARNIMERLQAHLHEKPKKREEIERITRESDAYHAAFGTKTARYYMYEQGIIDLQGDRRRQI